MSFPAFYLGLSSSLWLDACALLRERGQLHPVYWTTSPAKVDEVKRSYPGAVVQDVLGAIRGIVPPEAAGLPLLPPDLDLLHQLAWHQCMTLNMMTRMDPGGAFLFEERARYYKHLLSYWSSALDHFKPQLALFPVTPHAIYDYVVYGLCKLRGIPTLIVGATSFSRFYLYWDMEKGPENILAAYRKGVEQGPPQFSLSNHAQKHFDHVSGKRDANYLFTYRRYLERAGYSGRSGLAAAKSAAASLWPGVRGAHRFLTAPAPPNYLKQPGKTIADSEMTGLEWRLNKRRARRRKQALARLYASMCDQVELDRPYVYFPLHYQPENTTCPNGDAYDDQLLAAAMLAQALPEGWELYVKEYPNIFDDKLNGERARSETYYRELRAIGRIRLLPIGHNSFELIDHARAVATVTGSAGWEAVCRGKPVLTLGYAWYNGCEGVFHTPGLAQTRRALAEIARGYEVNLKKVRYFLHVFEQHCLKACADPLFQGEFELTPQENADMLAEAIAQACQTRLG